MHSHHNGLKTAGLNSLQKAAQKGQPVNSADLSASSQWQARIASLVLQLQDNPPKAVAARRRDWLGV